MPLADPPTLRWSVLSTRITRSWLARPPAALEPVLKTCVMQLRTCSMEPEMMYMSCEGGGGRRGGGRHSVSHARSRGLLGASHVGHPPCYVTGSLIATLRVPLEVRPSAKWLQPPSRLPSPKGTAHTSAEAP